MKSSEALRMAAHRSTTTSPDNSTQFPCVCLSLKVGGFIPLLFPLFYAGYPQAGFELINTKVLDSRVILLECRPGTAQPVATLVPRAFSDYVPCLPATP